ncbi:MAG: GntR family transcriptional regulator [Betaproteobacteria bacterium]|nr:GntR family transcriptional regulator [Betaproteobacteria bacterium]
MLAKPNLIESAYERLKADLFDFRMLPGERYSENELAVRLGVSRTPVRVALYLLAREGYLIKIEGHSGWMVRPLDFKYFEDLYDVRVNLEALAIQRICNTSPLPDLEPLSRDWLVPVEQRLADGAEMAQRDEAFHTAIVAAAGNPEMTRIHTDLTERIRIIRRLDFVSADRLVTTYEEHAGILRAILARREAEAVRLLRSHIESSKAEIRHITLHKLAVARENTAHAHTHQPEGERHAI